MINKNICRFIPYHQDYDSIHTINFVLETETQSYDKLKSESVYKMYYVCSGNGFIHTLGAVSSLSEGDIFFTFPGAPFCIESCENFSYMYISFLGTRGNMILDMLKISNSCFLFNGCAAVYSYWKAGLNTRSDLIDLISESILLYTFTFIGNKFLAPDKSAELNSDAVYLIKKYIDDNFSDPGLSLETISRKLNYNKKYISSVFKKNIKLGFVEYLNRIRIQYACTMIQQGYISVTDIARLCGYSDAHYFSRVFKKHMGISPRLYINSQIK
ncbi:MAG: helix-turn-helix transcriptional regulator [Clostridia bacterium]|nr:helix-turn-helix transcriptional regulator [Clostridia bacterium]